MCYLHWVARPPMDVHCEKFMTWPVKEMAAALAEGCLSTCPSCSPDAEGPRKERAGCAELIRQGEIWRGFLNKSLSTKTLNIPVWGKAVVLTLGIFYFSACLKLI